MGGSDRMAQSQQLQRRQPCCIELPFRAEHLWAAAELVHKAAPRRSRKRPDMQRHATTCNHRSHPVGWRVRQAAKCVPGRCDALRITSMQWLYLGCTPIVPRLYPDCTSWERRQTAAYGTAFPTNLHHERITHLASTCVNNHARGLRPVLTSPLAEWGWYEELSTVRSGLSFVTAPSPLLNLICLAALNTGIPFVGPLPVTLTLTLTTMRMFGRGAPHRRRATQPPATEWRAQHGAGVTAC
eukprot:351055-Chlamydomonas_euryale.AAC.7